jgi:hypothetical protein
MAFIVKRDAPRPIWKIAIFGAGTTTSNGEYVWDGVTLLNNKPRYDKVGGVFDEDYIGWDIEPNNFWAISDSLEGLTYISYNLISWNEGPDGVGPSPSSALSYSPNSVIQSLTLDGSEIATSSGTYDWDGVTTEGGKPKYVKTTAGGVNYIVWDGYVWALFDDEDIGDYTYTSNDLITWTDLPISAPPSPHVVTLSYSA